jgi:hypothetical protein
MHPSPVEFDRGVFLRSSRRPGSFGGSGYLAIRWIVVRCHIGGLCLRCGYHGRWNRWVKRAGSLGNSLAGGRGVTHLLRWRHFSWPRWSLLCLTKGIDECRIARSGSWRWRNLPVVGCLFGSEAHRWGDRWWCSHSIYDGGGWWLWTRVIWASAVMVDGDGWWVGDGRWRWWVRGCPLWSIPINKIKSKQPRKAMCHAS